MSNYSRLRRKTRNSVTKLGFELLESKRVLAANFVSFSVADASQDLTSDTVFESGALSIDFEVEVVSGSLQAVEVFAQSSSGVLKLGEFFSTSESGALISLDGFSSLSGTQQIYGLVSTSEGQHAVSNTTPIDVLVTTIEVGSFRGTDFAYTGTANSAYVLNALGGTDTLSLNFNASAVDSFNGESIASYDRDAFVTSQAFYQGSVYDFLTTNDGRELYFQGVERLEFADGSVTQLQTQPNDPEFVNQWDIATGDVGDAWRFTRGSDEVLIVSIDSGTASNGSTPITSDLDPTRTDFIIADDTSVGDGDHGHRATSVMVAQPNNNHGLTGLNWESPTLLIDVYGNPALFGQRLTNAIQASLDFLETSTASRIVFQGGIQGEFWLNTLDQSLISENLESTLYSVAAGNGSVDTDDPTTDPVLSAGVARLSATYDNVMAIGALEPAHERIHGIQNVTELPLASYSNFGDELTFSGPSRTRSIGPTGSVSNFGGTSNSNPVVAGYSSLVWSVDPTLTAVEVRDILTSTAMDLGAAGFDTQFGHGTPDAGAAVRRAWALSENPAMANIGDNPFAGAPGLGFVLSDSVGVAENIDTSTGNFDLANLSTTNSNLTSANFSLAAGSGDADNSLFEIASGNMLQFKQGTMVDFESQSSYSIHVEVSDGAATHDQQLTIAVFDEAESTSFVFANGVAQRSMLDQFVVEFDGIVTLGATPFEVVKRGPDGGVVDFNATVDDSSGNSVATLTFSGAFAESSGSLVDGNYQLTIFGDQIQTANGLNFDADGDGFAGGDFVFGDSETDNFFRLFGDSNGDRIVNLSDLLPFRRAWSSEEDDSDFDPNFDSNADGNINLNDLLRFRRNWMETSEFV